MAQIKKDTSLRKAILQAAITGQLISDVEGTTETGKQLLERIIEERNKKLLAEWEEALKKNPKAKKPTPIIASEIDEDEIPFEIPENWCWCRLGDLSDIVTGSTPSTTNPLFYNSSDFPFFKPSDLDQGYNVITSKDWISELGYSISRKVTKGSILVTCIGATIGKTGIVRFDGICNQQINALLKNNYLNFEYIYHVISSDYIQTTIRSNSSATTLPIINKEKFSELLLPLPPLSVQNAIVAKLEQVLPLVDAYENAVLQKEELKSTLSDKVKKAILQEAITGKLTEQWRKSAAITESGEQLLDRIIKERNAKALAEWEEKVKTNPKAKKPVPVVASEIEEDEIPFEIPESWCWCRLGDVCTKLVDGDHNPPAGLPIKTEYIMASSQNINNDSLVDLEKVRYLSKELFEEEHERTKAEEGDIFFTSVGTLGRSCVYDGSKNICFQRSVSVLKTEIYNKFLKYCLDAPFIQYFIIDNATGTAQKGFYLNQLSKLVIPLPPLEEQKEIVKKVEELLELCR